jgi:hypothetical protein
MFSNKRSTYIASDCIQKAWSSTRFVFLWIPHNITDFFPKLEDPLDNAKRYIQIVCDFGWLFLQSFTLIDDALLDITRVPTARLCR